MSKRVIGYLESVNISQGVGVIRDSIVWDNLRRAHPLLKGPSAASDSSAVDWKREMLVVISYGGVDAETDPGFNRAELRGGYLVIVLGPDSLLGSKKVFLDAISFPAVVAIPRMALPIHFESRVGDATIPAWVDWSTVK